MCGNIMIRCFASLKSERKTFFCLQVFDNQVRWADRGREGVQHYGSFSGRRWNLDWEEKRERGMGKRQGEKGKEKGERGME